jgi:hypothetical protein
MFLFFNCSFIFPVLGIREIIRLKKIEYFVNLEKKPQQALTEMIIADFLHESSKSQVNVKYNLLT